MVEMSIPSITIRPSPGLGSTYQQGRNFKMGRQALQALTKRSMLIAKVDFPLPDLPITPMHSPPFKVNEIL